MISIWDTWLSPQKRQNIMVAGEHGEGGCSLHGVWEAERRKGLLFQNKPLEGIPLVTCVFRIGCVSELSIKLWINLLMKLELL